MENDRCVRQLSKREDSEQLLNPQLIGMFCIVSEH